MASVEYSLQPQRRSPKGWQDCMEHQAERWVIFEHRRSGKYRVTRKYGAYNSKAVALDLQRELNRLAKPRPKAPSLGQRFIRTGRSIIARSLSYDQYHNRGK